MNSVKISSLVLMGAFTVGITSGSAVSAVAGTKDISNIASGHQEDELTELSNKGKDSTKDGDDSNAETDVDEGSDENKENVEDNLVSEDGEKNDKAYPENDEKFEESDDKIDVDKDPNKSNEADNNKLYSGNNGKVKSVDDVKIPGNTNTAKVAGAIGGILTMAGVSITVACDVAKELGQSNKDHQGQKEDEKKAKENNGDKNNTNPDPEKWEKESSFVAWYVYVFGFFVLLVFVGGITLAILYIHHVTPSCIKKP